MRGLQGLLVLTLFMFAFYGSADEKAVVDLDDHPETQGAFKVIDAWLQGRQTYDRIPGVSFGLVVDQSWYSVRAMGVAIYVVKPHLMRTQSTASAASVSCLPVWRRCN